MTLCARYRAEYAIPHAEPPESASRALGPPPIPAGPPLSCRSMLSARGQRWRTAAAAAIVLSIVWGSFFGEDDAFPLGPFRMYATASDPSGAVSVPYVEGRTAAAGWRAIVFSDFGLRRAEIEGQLGKLVTPRPVLLERLARSYNRFHSGAKPLTGLRLMYKSYILERGRPRSVKVTEAARWRPG